MKSKPQPFCVVARDGIPHSGKERVANPRYIVLLLLALLIGVYSPALAQRDDPENIEPPDSVTIAGTLQTCLLYTSRCV